ncbi:hypothetical protein GCM10009804_04190 [Kribbella hippodromi]|uniref:Transposase n=1 Tax=Kribbella hippodromi TaxID=434347 RepID=A0ABP4MVZ0_9ACTN
MLAAGTVEGVESTLLKWAAQVRFAELDGTRPMIRDLRRETGPGTLFQKLHKLIGFRHRKDPETVLSQGFPDIKLRKKFGADSDLDLRFRRTSHRMAQVAPLPGRDHSDAVP